jgi:hypothetical protein
MPNYEAECTECKAVDTYFSSIADRDNLPRCKCGGVRVRCVTSPAVFGDLNDFSTENGGKGRYNRQLKEYVRSVEDSNRKAALRGWSVLDKA